MVVRDARIITLDVHFHDELCAMMCGGIVVYGLAFHCAIQEVWHVEVPEQVPGDFALHSLQLKTGIIN
jgi:hypothetical protein